MTERPPDAEVPGASPRLEWLPGHGIVDLQAGGEGVGGLARRLPLSALPAVNGWQAGESEAIRVCGLAPGHWWLFCAASEAARWVNAIEPGAAGAVATSLGDAYCGARVSGDRAAEWLSQGCPLDLERLVAGACARTLLGRVPVLLIATATGSANSMPDRRVAFELWVERSYQRYLDEWLRTARAAMPADAG